MPFLSLHVISNQRKNTLNLNPQIHKKTEIRKLLLKHNKQIIILDLLSQIRLLLALIKDTSHMPELIPGNDHVLIHLLNLLQGQYKVNIQFTVILLILNGDDLIKLLIEHPYVIHINRELA